MDEDTKKTSPKERRCKACRHHGKDAPASARKHQCPYKDCQQTLCRVARVQREVIKSQQRVWRTMASKIGVRTVEESQLCDNCRNHSIVMNKKGHNDCPFAECHGALCEFTKRRRQIYRFMTRIDRKKITCDKFEEILAAHTQKGSLLKNTKKHDVSEKLLGKSVSSSTSRLSSKSLPKKDRILQRWNKECSRTVPEAPNSYQLLHFTPHSQSFVPYSGSSVSLPPSHGSCDLSNHFYENDKNLLLPPIPQTPISYFRPWL